MGWKSQFLLELKQFRKGAEDVNSPFPILTQSSLPGTHILPFLQSVAAEGRASK